MKYKQVSYKLVEYHDLQDEIVKHFGLKEWNIPYDLEMNNNSYLELHVCGKDEVEEDSEDYSTYDYLTLLVRDGVIEDGKYMLHVSW